MEIAFEVHTVVLILTSTVALLGNAFQWVHNRRINGLNIRYAELEVALEKRVEGTICQVVHADLNRRLDEFHGRFGSLEEKIDNLTQHLFKSR